MIISVKINNLFLGKKIEGKRSCVCDFISPKKTRLQLFLIIIMGVHFYFFKLYDFQFIIPTHLLNNSQFSMVDKWRGLPWIGGKVHETDIPNLWCMFVFYQQTRKLQRKEGRRTCSDVIINHSMSY